MSELEKRIEAEDARINAYAKERLIAAQRMLEAEIKWIEFDAAESKILRQAQWINRILWGGFVGILGSGLIWAIFGKF